MGLLSAFTEERAINHEDFDLALDLFGPKTSAGISVTKDNATSLVAAWAAITLIVDSIRVLPVDVFRKRDSVRESVARPPQWIDVPNIDQTWPEFVDYLLQSLLTDGNAYPVIISRDDLGFPSELKIAHPDDVKLERRDGRKVIEVNNTPMSLFNPRTGQGEVLHIPGYTADGVKGLSPVEKAAEAIAAGLAIEEYGNRFFSNGTSMPGAIEMPQGSVPDEDQIKKLASVFSQRHGGLKNAWKPLVLGNGAQYKPLTVPNDQAQFLESAKFNVNQIARLYRVPPHLIADVERSTSWGTGIEEQNIGFVQYTLMPWISRIENRFSLLLPRGQYIRLNTNSLLRGDIEARSNFYQTMGQLKAMNINEIRALEDMPPLDDGDRPPPAPNESL